MKYDVCVIGGGPAGLMAAGKAAENGAKVILLEKNHGLGAKLLITGKGRCNITNKTEDWREFLAKFGPKGKFLTKALNNFGIDETIEFFESRGVKTKVEEGKRVFPVSNIALDVLKALISYVKKNGVEIKTSVVVKTLSHEDAKITKVVLKDGTVILADKFIIATGGKSYPATGSTGEGYLWLKKLGHNIIEPRPALVPINVKEKWVKELEGLSLKNVEISIINSETNKIISSKFGEAIFTDRGMSGPVVLSLSREIENFENLKLRIDFKPALDEKTLDQRIQDDFKEFNNKQFNNALDKLLPQKLIPVFVRQSGINPNKKVNLISREERLTLVKLFKNFEMQVWGLGDFDEAIITAGGVDLKEVDPRTMKSKIIENLYLCGEILDIDGPTGGYNLQVCWSTGMLAGELG